MELSEDQILRFSRQILLREVGGRGQRALLEASVEVRGEGPALATAAAYLGAAGSAVCADPQPALPGFPSPPIAELSSPRGVIRTAGVPGPSDPSRDQVLLGGGSGGAVVVSVPPGTCPGCIARTLRGAEGPVPGRVAELAGALGALLQQRRILGLAQGPEVVRVSAEGELRVEPLQRCEACG